MKRLEDFVLENRDDFDSKLPSPDLWDRIENELEKKKPRTFKLWQWSAAIAAILVIALVSTFMLRQGGNMDSYANIADTELKELLETEAYYSSQVSGKMNEIQKCYNIYPELKMDIENDLNELDIMYMDLRNDLNDNMYNREVIEAMIQNNRVRLKMVNRVLNQVNC